MKNTKKCPKCQSSDIVQVPGKREGGLWKHHSREPMEHPRGGQTSAPCLLLVRVHGELARVPG